MEHHHGNSCQGGVRFTPDDYLPVERLIEFRMKKNKFMKNILISKLYNIINKACDRLL